MPNDLGAATYSAPLDFRISPAPPDNIPPETRAAFEELYNAFQQAIQALVNFAGIGPQPRQFWDQLASSPSTILATNMGRFYVRATENISGGAIINVQNVAGVANVRNANATTNVKPAHGFCSTPGGIASGTVGEVILGSGVVSIGGLTVGTRYFLSTTNGLITAAAPVAAGNIEQPLGVAVTPSQLFFWNSLAWTQH